MTKDAIAYFNSVLRVGYERTFTSENEGKTHYHSVRPPLGFVCDRCAIEVVDDIRKEVFDSFYEYGLILCSTCRHDFDNKFSAGHRLERNFSKGIITTHTEKSGIINQVWNSRTVEE